MNIVKIINTAVFLIIQFNICIAETIPSDSSIVKILPQEKKDFIFTKHQISERRNEKSVLLTSVKSVITDAVEYKDTLWVGTSEGLYKYSLRNETLEQCKLISSNLNITKIKKDAAGVLWVASINDGLWRIKDSEAQKVLDVSPVYALEISKDTTVWAGTNVGLYKLKNLSNAWQRYAEEGYSGYEIPDNIVENLFCDAHNNTWVIMPDEFAFIRSNTAEEHVPGFRNISAQDFELKYITEIFPDQYLFVTSKGIFLMPNSPHEHGHDGHEIKSGPEQKMYLLTNKQLLLTETLDTKQIHTATVDRKGNLLLSNDTEIYCIKRKTMKRVVNNLSKS